MPIGEPINKEQIAKNTNLMEEVLFTNSKEEFIKKLKEMNSKDIFPHFLERMFDILEGNDAAAETLREEIEVAQKEEDYSETVFSRITGMTLSYLPDKGPFDFEELQSFSEELCGLNSRSEMISKLSEFLHRGIMFDLYTKLFESLAGDKQSYDDLLKMEKREYQNEDSFHNKLIKKVIEFED